MTMHRNEAQTRFELIDPALEQRGWRRTEDIRLEERLGKVDIVYGRGQRRPKGRADYVLRRPLAEGGEPTPLAIIEAKREGLPPEHGLQQGEGYRAAQLQHVPFVFSSNGHQFVEYDEATGQTSDPRPMAEFPTPDELVRRYLEARQLSADAPELKLLCTRYDQGRDHLRYYQDAAIRAALEQIIRRMQAKEAPRILLALATGSGKTRLAVALLRRLHDAGYVGRALFLCDRTELRDHGLGDFQAAFGNDAAEVGTRNPQKNARVLIATYQTLAHTVGQEDGKDVSFFTRHYPPGYFDVVVVDECHRSAWGDWHEFLLANREAIQIGLTATPRQLKLPDAKDALTKAELDKDRRRLADNYRYFGEPAYEYPTRKGSKTATSPRRRSKPTTCFTSRMSIPNGCAECCARILPARKSATP